MADALIWVPGHLCGAALYAPQRAQFGGTLADTLSDDGLAAMAARLLADAPPRFVIAGLSMGGMVALEVMAQAPQRVAGVLLMDTDPMPARDVERAWRAGELADLRAAGPQGYVRRFAGRFFAHDPETQARLLPPMLAEALAMPVPVLEAQARALENRDAMLPRIAGFAAPVEVVVGALDRLCPPRLHQPIVAACRDAVLTEIPRCGHISTLEAPDAIAARLSALLNRI